MAWAVFLGGRMAFMAFYGFYSFYGFSIFSSIAILDSFFLSGMAGLAFLSISHVT